MGATLARLERGDLQAEEIAFRYLRSNNKFIQGALAARLGEWMAVMAEAIGKPLRLPDDLGHGITPEQAGEMIGWWRNHVTAKLLRDTVCWDKGQDVRWRRVGRLMGARTIALEWLGLD